MKEWNQKVRREIVTIEKGSKVKEKIERERKGKKGLRVNGKIRSNRKMQQSTKFISVFQVVPLSVCLSVWLLGIVSISFYTEIGVRVVWGRGIWIPYINGNCVMKNVNRIGAGGGGRRRGWGWGRRIVTVPSPPLLQRAVCDLELAVAATVAAVGCIHTVQHVQPW